VDVTGWDPSRDELPLVLGFQVQPPFAATVRGFDFGAKPVRHLGVNLILSGLHSYGGGS